MRLNEAISYYLARNDDNLHALSKRAGVSYMAMRNIMDGASPKLVTLEKIAHGLGTDIGKLISKAEEYK